MDHQDWASIAEAVGLELLGEPKSNGSGEIRWGTHGSWKLDKEKGVFYSFELDQGFAVSELLKHFDQDITQTLEKFGFKDAVRSEEHTLNSSHITSSYAVFCLKNKKKKKSIINNNC